VADEESARRTPKASELKISHLIGDMDVVAAHEAHEVRVLWVEIMILDEGLTL